MKLKDKIKLQKALGLIQKADILINEVATSDEKFRFDGNANFRIFDINRLIRILEQDIKHM
jgi:hypothetical protein